jgi:hypothetical protein
MQASFGLCVKSKINIIWFIRKARRIGIQRIRTPKSLYEKPPSPQVEDDFWTVNPISKKRPNLKEDSAETHPG